MQHRARLLALIAAPLTCAAPSLAQQPPAPHASPPAQPLTQPPTLDDLLGLPKNQSRPNAKPRPEASDPSKEDLARKLSAGEVSDQFKQAVQLMGQTAERLQTAKDTGLATQRLQEDIIRKLDQIIKAAEQNQQQSKSVPSKQQQDQKQQPSQQQQQRNPDGKEAAPDSMDPPGGKAANPTPGVAARGAAWGALPTRLREALLQGNEDKYSALYQKWTEAYYRRLAEDANK